MKRTNETGDIVGVLLIGVIVALTIVLGFSVYSYISAANQNAVFDGWVQKCSAIGGVSKQTAAINSNTEWYDCYVNNEPVLVPGYESYEKDRPANLPPIHQVQGQ